MPAKTKQGRRIVAQGRRYWADKPTRRGKVAAIGWAPHSGSWTRCVSRVSKYMGPGAKGYCALRMHDATGMWPGSKANRGRSRSRRG
jgi:hypothetical protein